MPTNDGSSDFLFELDLENEDFLDAEECLKEEYSEEEYPRAKSDIYGGYLFF